MKKVEKQDDQELHSLLKKTSALVKLRERKGQIGGFTLGSLGGLILGVWISSSLPAPSNLFVFLALISGICILADWLSLKILEEIEKIEKE